MTGLSSVTTDLTGKRLQLLKEAVPKVSRVAFLYNPTILGTVLSVKEAQVAAPPLGLTVQPVEVRAPDELGSAFDAMTRSTGPRPCSPLGTPSPLPTKDESWTSRQSGGCRRRVIGWSLRAALSATGRTVSTCSGVRPPSWTRS